jgi:signal transduction histidine kinase
LTELGFLPALSQLAHSQAERGQFNIHLDLPPQIDLPKLTEQTLYRITQEALENVVRHAEAEQVWVQLQTINNTITLTIRDDGVGFNPQEMQNRWGIQGMQERANMLGGHLHIHAIPKQGTTITLQTKP